MLGIVLVVIKEVKGGGMSSGWGCGGVYVLVAC